ncbi:hypothetical protein TNCV_3479811 [Trichonephila clavipes]|nr:hypothetical protein TNCV_3479811 [Trichonephila clavipes]
MCGVSNCSVEIPQVRRNAQWTWMLMYLSPVSPISNQLRMLHTLTESPLACPLLICKVPGFMRLSPYPYSSNRSIHLETRLVRPGNVFPIINSPMSVWMGPGEA